MRGNQIGKLFSITTFGESHGKALGVVLDGVPPGMNFDHNDLQALMARRSPGIREFNSSRKEPDQVEILSGIFEGKTLGTPITAIVYNKDQRSGDYSELKNSYRPGHADKTTEIKYGIRDYRGGGRASGRETLARVIGGYFAGLVLPTLQCKTAITQVAHFQSDDNHIPADLGEFGFIEPSRDNLIIDFLKDCKARGESCGGKVLLTIDHCPAGLGEPVFDKLKADLAHAMLSIGSCVGATFGLGTKFASLLGSEISEQVDNFGGIEGGISNGERITMELYFKAPSTIGDNAKKGRHDPCILPRVLVVIESMAKIIIADHYLRQKAYQEH